MGLAAVPLRHNPNRQHHRTNAHLLFRQVHRAHEAPRHRVNGPGLADREGIDMAKRTEAVQETLRCPKCTGLLAEATGVCTVCGADPLGYYCDEWDHRKCDHS